jgi:hypothetical protein
MKNKTYSVFKKTGSTVKKSQARMPCIARLKPVLDCGRG